MVNLSSSLAVWCAIFGVAQSIKIAALRDTADRDSVNSASLLRRQTGTNPTKLGASLYWFGNWTVGDASDLKLLIDTGSSDCILNLDVYKPSKNSKPYAGKKFSITYEGVNREGFGFETINGTLIRDTVSAGGLSVKEQAIGNTTVWKYIDVPQLPYGNQGNGIIGFLGTGSSSFIPKSPSWFNNLCNTGAISSCEFGLAFGTGGTGQVAIGELDKSLYTGDLVTVNRYIKPLHAYTVYGDVTLDGKIVATDQKIIMDVGTDNIQGPIEVTTKILKMLGYPTNTFKQAGNGAFNDGETSITLLGYFPCDKPPTLGFSFPAQSKLGPGRKAVNFDVSKDVWNVYNNGNNNCTSILGGTNALDNPKDGSTAWLLGQSFFAGHYIHFDVDAQTVSYANLKNPTTGL